MKRHNTRPQYFFPALLINIFTILASSFDASIMQSALRWILIIIATLLVVFYQLIFYPNFIVDELRSCMLRALCSLKKLNNDIFACLLAPEYPDNIYLYERRIHMQKNKYLCAIECLRKIEYSAQKKLGLKHNDIYQQRLNKLNLLYANMMDYAQIRRRVTDHTTFSLSAKELNQVAQEIDQSMQGLIAHIKNKKFYPNTTLLGQKINELENHYQHILQIASREPLAFLLFINSLKHFRDNLNSFNAIPLP